MVEIGRDIALPVIEKMISKDQITRYADASGDHNPLHLDPEFASNSQFGGIIAHGMLTLAFISEMLTRAFGQSWLETGKLKVRLKAPAYPGDKVRTWGKVTKEDVREGKRMVVCAIGLSDSNGREMITGDATLFLPLKARVHENHD